MLHIVYVIYFNFPLVLVGCSLRSQLLVIAP